MYINNPQKRFWNKVKKTDSCWLWQGNISTSGYGRMPLNYKHIYAHRFSYELFHGEIPTKLVIDHLCRNKLCVNPQHLEAVTQRENVERSPFFEGKKTYCKQGHLYNKENIYYAPSSPNKRKCKECNKLNQRKYRQEGRYAIL